MPWVYRLDEIHISEQPTRFTTVHGTAVTASCSGGRWAGCAIFGGYTPVNSDASSPEPVSRRAASFKPRSPPCTHRTYQQLCPVGRDSLTRWDGPASAKPAIALEEYETKHLEKLSNLSSR